MTRFFTRTLTALILLTAFALPALAQGTVAPVAKQQFLDTNGNPLALGRLYVYQAGTTTPATIYTDATLLVPALNAAICGCSNLDGSGRFTYFLASSSYRFTLKTSSDVLVWDVDGVASVPPSSINLDLTITAGEAIAVNQCGYVSDGSGGKNAGRVYKCDPANAYSSTSPQIVGIAATAISLNATGFLRVSGQIAGLSSLVAGAKYYAGTAGALTTTAPALARNVATADTVSSLIVAPAAALSNSDNGIQDFRLSALTGTAVPQNDVTAATTLYCTPAGRGNRIALFDSVGSATVYTSAEFSIAVPGTTNTNYDVFVFANAGVPALELSAWRNSGQAVTGATNATPIVITSNSHGLSNGDQTYIAGVFGNTAANGTWTVANVTANTYELATSVGNGAYTAATGYMNARLSTATLVRTTTGTDTKTGDLTRRYLGTIRTTGVSGQIEDSLTKRFVWNYYNQKRRRLRSIETTSGWTWTTASWRQINANTANQVDMVIGVAESSVTMQATELVLDINASIPLLTAIGLDSTTQPYSTTGLGGSWNTGTVGGGTTYTYYQIWFQVDIPTGPGRHFLPQLEFGGTGGNQSGGTATSGAQTGQIGYVEG